MSRRRTTLPTRGVRRFRLRFVRHGYAAHVLEADVLLTARTLWLASDEAKDPAWALCKLNARRVLAIRIRD